MEDIKNINESTYLKTCRRIFADIFNFIFPPLQTMRVTDWSGFVDFVDRVRPARLDLRRLPYVKVLNQICRSLFKVYKTSKNEDIQRTFCDVSISSCPDARRDLGGDRDGGGAEDGERHPPRVPAHLLRRHEQGDCRENAMRHKTRSDFLLQNWILLSSAFCTFKLSAIHKK